MCFTRIVALSSRLLVLSTFGSFIIGGAIIACGSDGSKFDDGTGNTGTFGEGGLGDIDGSAFDPYKDDPAPKWCGPDAGTPGPQVEGSAECPSDKNKPGCPCATPGAEADCWTGLRKDRNLGICRDGKTTCTRTNEFSSTWGECRGQVLPQQNAVGAQACDCFSLGKWDIANTSPCFKSTGDVYTAYSTKQVTNGDPTTNGCQQSDPTPTPGSTMPDWSTDKLKVDCAGTFTLCFRIRAGDYNNPSANDCVLGESCVQNATYADTSMELQLPNLPGWVGTNAACAKKWEKDTPNNVSPGYGEMIVKGQTVTCDEVGSAAGDYVFHRVQYCPKMCRGGANPTAPECVACQTASSGEFTPEKN